MSVEDNKNLVRQACSHLSARNLPALFELIHDDGSWSIPYRQDLFQFGGHRDKPGVLQLLTEFLQGFDSFSFTIDGITAEANRVAIEAHSSGTGPGAANYQNVYNMIFLIKDGKLHTIREYFDPFQVNAYVAQLGAS